jgi:glucosamine-6-phosphate deaminase
MTHYGKTEVVLCDSNTDLGRRSAGVVAARIRHLLGIQAEVRLVLAAGESQSSFLAALAGESGIAWDRVICFNIDEFWDVRRPEQFSCGAQTTRELYQAVRPKAVHLVRFNAVDPQAECDRFEALLRAAPLDILCQGIGTSGHLALDEPDQCSFTDPRWVRLVDLVPQSKKQLIADPNFAKLGYIPEQGITMTIPAIFSAGLICTIVPLALKKPILSRLAATPAATVSLPASILREHPGLLFVDRDSCPDAWKS